MAVVLTLVETKHIRIDKQERNNTKSRYKQQIKQLSFRLRHLNSVFVLPVTACVV